MAAPRLTGAAPAPLAAGLAGTAVVLLLLAGVLGARHVAASPVPDAIPAPAPTAISASPPPTRIEIAGIGVDAGIGLLGLDQEGALQVPADFAKVGWWVGGPIPGEPGPAVLVGHLDSRSGPAVFHRLDDVKPGDEVRVRRAGGEVVTFVVERSQRYSKGNFPTAEVYGPTSAPTLRLITCAGSFDRKAREYRDNLVVYARMVA